MRLATIHQDSHPRFVATGNPAVFDFQFRRITSFTTMAITDWPAALRPRERLIHLGAAALSDAELLAVFLRVGIPGKSAVDLARDMVSHFGSLAALFSADIKNFCSINGLGPAKFAQLQAVLELARRALEEELQEGELLSSPKAVRDYLQLLLRGKLHEVFLVLFLDAQNKLISAEEMFRGTLTHTSVYPREVVKAALARNAAGVILAHNHPSGTAEPSMADHNLTESLKTALALIDVKVLDHFIVGAQKSYSFVEHGML